ncbi:MAG: acetyl-CoA C-acetyltransferase [Steroidobacteraceae bacterium]|nr:acetyl-CoA C-acetyltransferase [Pseudomonadota bacterium]MBP7615686.1 acetyl-CoA C-acetyltransferase [Steroidobacteraceae bacterium]
MTKALIFDALRTPRGRGKSAGSIHEVTPVRLASQVLREIVHRNLPDAAQVEDVALGCVSAAGEQGGLIARSALFHADLPNATAALHVNRFCGSALEAVNIIAAKVISGEIALGIGGGVESMSRVPLGADGGAWSMDPEVAFKARFVPQGVSADLIATRYGFSRQACDEFACESHRRAASAWREGRFGRSIIPVTDILDEVILTRDELVRESSDLEAMAALKPSFESMGREGGFDAVALQKYPELAAIQHVHHAGNSSAIADGASAVLIGTARAGRKAGLKPRARILAMAGIGSEPTIMLTAPELAAKKALGLAMLSKNDIDLWEVNEAFASVVLRFAQAMDLGLDTVNVNGGAIAMGHPTGATGAMLVGTVLDELERRGQSLGLVTLCVGGGMGVATIIERLG